MRLSADQDVRGIDLAMPPAIDNGLTRIFIASLALSTPAPNLHRTIPQNIAVGYAVGYAVG